MTTYDTNPAEVGRAGRVAFGYRFGTDEFPADAPATWRTAAEVLAVAGGTDRDVLVAAAEQEAERLEAGRRNYAGTGG